MQATNITPIVTDAMRHGIIVRFCVLLIEFDGVKSAFFECQHNHFHIRRIKDFYLVTLLNSFVVLPIYIFYETASRFTRKDKINLR